jgi:hypothetical protein
LCSSAPRAFGSPQVSEIEAVRDTVKIDVRFASVGRRYLTVLTSDGYTWRVTGYREHGETAAT